MQALIDIVLLGFLAVIAIAAVRLRDLFGVVMLFGIYSLICATLFMVLDAVDVAFTEAAVGAGVSTVLMLSTIALTARQEKNPKENPPSHNPLLPLLTVGITGAVLAYGTWDMPLFGDAGAPVHQHVAPHYLTASGSEIGIPNVVTSVLASYRGYDTLGEVTVIFTAGVGVLALLGTRRLRRRGEQDREGQRR